MLGGTRTQLLARYLFVSGLLAHLAAAAVLVHFKSTGVTAHYYVNKVADRLDRDSSPTRHVARFTRFLLLDSGLLSDPATLSLPSFPGPDAWPAQATRAEGFRRLRFDERGVPLQSSPGPFRPGVADRVIRVTDARSLQRALKAAEAGDVITLEAGVYRFGQRRISLGSGGTPAAPIVVRAERLGDAVLELDTLEGFFVDSPYWLFENLEIRGSCSNDSRCEHAFHVVGEAHGTTLRNNRLIDFNAPLKVNGSFGGGRPRFPDYGLVHNNAVFNTRIRNTGNPVTLLNINAGNGWVVSANFIADFAKGRSDRVSYAAFMKSNSEGGIFERNLVVCHWKLPLDEGVRVGLSFGGGGSSASISRGGSNVVEHSGGIMRHNVIARCPRDVGIYLNRAAGTRIRNNLLVGTRGIDVRFGTSWAFIADNVLDGRIFARDGGSFRATNNLVEESCGWIDRVRGRCGSDYWYAAPLRGDLRLVALETFLGMRRSAEPTGLDFCGRPRPERADIGPLQYGSSALCLPASP